MRDIPFPGARQEEAIPNIIREQRLSVTGLWWSRDQAMPVFSAIYSPSQQAENEKKLDRMIDGLVYELKHLPASGEERKAWIENQRPGLIDFAHTALGLEPRHIDFIESTGMVEASQEFARMARRFDPTISGEDIYQAGRNVMTANLLQLLLGLPVEVTPSVFAYSMLYPYTDNYLDDPAIAPATKLAFNHRFQRRLQGEQIRLANDHEAAISKLVGMIETQWNRQRYPQVYDSLLAIHAAQARSLKLVAPGAAPYELDVLGVSFEKGGASVLADGYLVAGWMTPEQAAFAFGYGAYTQFMDDLEDIQTDIHENRATIFSQTAGRWPLDRLANRMFHFGRAIFGNLSGFPSQTAGTLAEIFARGIDPVFVDIIGRSGKYFSKEYLRELERHVPFRFASTRKQREKLTRQKLALGKLVDTLVV